MARFHFCPLLAVVIANVWLLSQVSGKPHSQFWPDGSHELGTVTQAQPFACIGKCCYHSYHTGRFGNKYYSYTYGFDVRYTTSEADCTTDCERACGTELARIRGYVDRITAYCYCRASKPSKILRVVGGLTGKNLA